MADDGVHAFMTALADAEVAPHGSGVQRRGRRGRKPAYSRALRSEHRAQRERCDSGARLCLGANLEGGPYRELCETACEALDRVVASLYAYMSVCGGEGADAAAELECRGDVTGFWVRHRERVDAAILAMERPSERPLVAAAATGADPDPAAQVGAAMAALALEATAIDIQALLYAMVPMVASVIGGPSLAPYAASDGRVWLEAAAVTAPRVLAATLPHDVLDMLALQLTTQAHAQFYMFEEEFTPGDDERCEMRRGNLRQSVRVAERLIAEHVHHAAPPTEGDGAPVDALADRLGLEECRRPTKADVINRSIAREMHWIRAWTARVDAAGADGVELRFGVPSVDRTAVVRLRRVVERAKLPSRLDPETLRKQCVLRYDALPPAYRG